MNNCENCGRELLYGSKCVRCPAPPAKPINAALGEKALQVADDIEQSLGLLREMQGDKFVAEGPERIRDLLRDCAAELLANPSKVPGLAWFADQIGLAGDRWRDTKDCTDPKKVNAWDVYFAKHIRPALLDEMKGGE